MEGSLSFVIKMDITSNVIGLVHQSSQIHKGKEGCGGSFKTITTFCIKQLMKIKNET